MSDLSQESPLWREWAESRHSVQQMRDELDRLRAENARLLAAAPELVEALKLWARWNDMTEAELAIALEATTAALAKAGVK